MESSRVCPRLQAEGSGLEDWMPLFMHYRGGHLYCTGGVADQPALYMRVMRLIDGAMRQNQS